MKRLITICLVVMFASGTASAGIIRSGVVVENNMGFYNPFFPETKMLDQSGLATNYNEGVTDWDTYFAGSPLHHSPSSDYEWWSSSGETGGYMIIDLGDVYYLDRIALWNEDAVGLSSISISTDIDLDFSDSQFVGNFTPTDHVYKSNYLADILDVTDSVARYIRINVVKGVNEGNMDALAIGEMAFSTVIPAPGAILLGSIGVGLVGCLRRRRKL